jgi:Kef-type K+ transport system membrane component KefB/Trk K+ transport system NAD-binding subunit
MQHHPDIFGAISFGIVAATLIGLVVRRLGQPLILGYIIGGAILGPHLGFGVIHDQEAIELISEMGLILLLFIIGLEISIPRLMQAGRTIAVAGILQFPLCAILAYLVFSDIGAGRFDRLYVAVALGLSSTLIVVKLLFDKFEMSTFAGRVTLGVLIFQDFWAIAFLAVQPNLANLQAGPLLKSLVAGGGLVLAAVLLSRYVLPGLFRSIARSTELVLLTAMTWCFIVAGVAGWVGLSKEMGALIAGMVIAAFPYGTEVTARLTGVRDFFITLFFVALGLKIPQPTLRLSLLAVAAAAFVVVSRFVVLGPLFAMLRLDARTAGVVSVNLAQVSEFSLVIVALGAGHGHVSPEVGSVVLFTMLLTSVLSTYGILFNHEIATALARFVAKLGLPIYTGKPGQPEPAASSDGHGHGGGGDVFLLGVSREGLAFVQHLERESPEMKAHLVAVDFNPETLASLQADGVECHYGDIANVETLRHAGIDRARIVVLSVSDWFLKGTSNLTLLRVVRGLAPKAQVIATADRLVDAETLYSEGAAYVLIPPALSAEHLYRLLLDRSEGALEAARAEQMAELFSRGRAPAADAESGGRV